MAWRSVTAAQACWPVWCGAVASQGFVEVAFVARKIQLDKSFIDNLYSSFEKEESKDLIYF